ncbi:MAG TPA: hypothetical protein VGU65_09905 [Frateuria sp.]|uniref:hypothetical protein n=1 Tax=Frateuria sp. TaxID=2211372 RepID=UPI002DF227EB|nr:hypothetical protein [Frateuria sp.]
MNRPRAICLLLCLAAATPASAAAAPVQAVTPAPALRYPARPIASRAQLDAYLRDTPVATSPLGALTAAGRQRFLATLAFSEHGLGGFGTDDLRYDLTRTQAWQVLRLFAVEGYAAELPARTRPRPSDGPGATLEAAYDRLAATPGDTASAAALYVQAFAPSQASLASLGGRDVELLFRATARMAHAQPGLLADLRRDFGELARRDRIDRPHASAFYDALLAAHRSDEARALLEAYPVLRRTAPPTLRSASDLRDGRPSVWIAHGGHELWRVRLTLDNATQVIVLGSPRCHYSQAAARDIDADPQLSALFRANAQWVAPPGDIVDFDALEAWNRAHPSQRLAILNAAGELPFVHELDTPVFYLLRHGQLAATVVGWPGPQQRDALRRRLAEVGLLQSSGPSRSPPSTDIR